MQTVEHSDSNNTSFIDYESDSEESDGDSDISIISNGEVCFATSWHTLQTDMYTF